MLKPGDPAPPFELPNHEGDTVSLSDYSGRRLVVYFYPRADTPGCTTEACGFRDEWERYTDRNIQVLAISDDPVADLASFAEKYDLPFQLLSDESGTVAAAYGSYGEKNMFGNTFDGVFRNTYVIDSQGRIELVYENVSPDGHAEQILDDIDQANTESP